MSKKQSGADADTADKQTANDTQVIVKVLVNGALFNGAHHAAGKRTAMPKSKADVLAGMSPPQVAIIGV